MKFLSRSEAKKEILKILLKNSEYKGSDIADVVLKTDFKEIDFNFINFIFNKLEAPHQQAFIRSFFSLTGSLKNNKKTIERFADLVSSDVYILFLFYISSFSWGSSNFFADVLENAEKLTKRKFKKISKIIEEIFKNYEKLNENIDFKIEDFKIYKFIDLKVEDFVEAKNFLTSLNKEQAQIFIKWLDNNFNLSKQELKEAIYQINNTFIISELAKRNTKALKNLLKLDSRIVYILLDNIQEENYTILAVFETISKKEIDIKTLDFDLIFEKIKLRKNKYTYLKIIKDIKKISKEEILNDVQNYLNNIDFHNYIANVYGFCDTEILKIIKECLKISKFDTRNLNVKELKILLAYHQEIGKKIIAENDYEKKVVLDFNKPENKIEKEIDRKILNDLAKQYFVKKIKKKEFDFVDLLKYHQDEVDDAYSTGFYGG